MKKALPFFLSAGLLVLLLSSCTTFGREREAVPYRYFQRMASDGAIVVTLDAEQEPELVSDVFSGMPEFGSRTSRISVVLRDPDGTYPLTGEHLLVDGVVEGDFPMVMVNTGLLYASDFRKTEDPDGSSWYTKKDDSLHMYAEHNGAVFFSNGSYPQARLMLDSPRTTIDNDRAFAMADAAIAVYADYPTTFFDLGLGLTKAMLEKTRNILLLVHETEQGRTVDAILTMDSQKTAETLSKMVRTGYLTKLRRESLPFTIPALMKMFSIEDNVLTIEGMQMTEEQMQTLRRNLIGLL